MSFWQQVIEPFFEGNLISAQSFSMVDFPFEGWNTTWNDVWNSLQRPFFVQETMDPWTKLLITGPSLYTNKNLTMKHHFSDISYWKPINPSSHVVYPSLLISSNDLGESLWTHRLTSPWEDSQREQTQNGPTFQLWNRCNDLPRTVVYSQNWRANLQPPQPAWWLKHIVSCRSYRNQTTDLPIYPCNLLGSVFQALEVVERTFTVQLGELSVCLNESTTVFVA